MALRWLFPRMKLMSLSCVWAPVCVNVCSLLLSITCIRPDQHCCLGCAAPSSPAKPGTERKPCKHKLSPPGRDLPWERCSRGSFTWSLHLLMHQNMCMKCFSVPYLPATHHHPNLAWGTSFGREPKERKTSSLWGCWSLPNEGHSKGRA